MAVTLVLCRGWVIRLDAEADGLHIVNWTRTVEVAWSELERFEFDGGVTARRKDLSAVPLSAFPSPSRDIFGIASRRNEAAYRALESTRKRREGQARKQRQS